MQEFRMPALGADMEKGKLVQWNVSPGSRVRPGDIVAVVETQKGAIDVEIFLDGVIEDLVPVGTELMIGGVLARVRQEGEAMVPQAVPSPDAGPVKASPGARRRARELGVDMAAVRGTGPEGSITSEDVERSATQAKAPARAPSAAGFDPAAMRAAIAAAMSRSKREIPHFYLAQEVDFGPAERWLAAYNAERPPAERLLPAVLLLKASARALENVPQLNGFWRDGQVQLAQTVHVGWAISLRGGGLVAPAVHDAGRRTLAELMAALRDLVQRARAGGLRSSELADPTVTVTSLGERGADSVAGVIYPPQLALIGFGRIAPRPWVHDGAIVASPTVHVSLAADHRASDRHAGGLLLAAIADALQAPATLDQASP
jgi:pyruvate dehydrogenase E2 component (dihydrolipoamide acetyltransferase)